MNKTELEIKKKKSLKYSIFDGSFYSAMTGFGESFFAPFAIFLKATSLELGILTTLPLAIGSIFQLYTKKILSFFKTRKGMVLFFVILQAIMYIPIAFVFLFSKLNVFYLILFASMYMGFGMFISPVWMSWMGDLVDETKRGRYFGRRNQIIGFVAFFTYLIGGVLLEEFTKGNKQYIGFVILFILAFFSRIISFYFLTRKYEPKLIEVKEEKFSFYDFVKDSKNNNYGRFVLFMFLMNFSLYFAAPFFAPYMLNELKFDYVTFVIINGVMLAVKYLMMPVWGKLADKYGNKKVFNITGIMMPFVPLMWVFSHNFYYLIAVQIYSGFVWAGFELATFNFLFDATNKETRTKSISYYNVLNGFAIVLGGAVGGIFLMTKGHAISTYLLIFGISFILRIMTSIIMLPKIKEVRNVKNISNQRLIIKVVSRVPGWTVFFSAMNYTSDKMSNATDTTVKYMKKTVKK